MLSLQTDVVGSNPPVNPIYLGEANTRQESYDAKDAYKGS